MTATNPPQTFLAQPSYGDVTIGASRALWQASREMQNVTLSVGSNSLLAMNFNLLWCKALNLALAGQPIRYFAMIHSDIAAEDFWLDKLIEELERIDADVLSAVVPLKSHQGLTSTALDGGDKWRIKCRLSMHEVFRLPETFTQEDVGHPLLINTGLWVCRFDREWVRKHYFTIDDRIVFDERENQYRVEAEGEDWLFSRQCNELGLKIAATRKVQVRHEGRIEFPNSRPWGSEKFDSLCVGSSLIK